MFVRLKTNEPFGSPGLAVYSFCSPSRARMPAGIGTLDSCGIGLAAGGVGRSGAAPAGTGLAAVAILLQLWGGGGRWSELVAATDQGCARPTEPARRRNARASP